ncbi:hypothetical protein VP01_1420g1 [Puccinia sorghi]|uniref:General transcription and DNA repair factor IIH subunit TFB5 n=1 Tax=Puccinia sorghi TaxID=27349 RepID=A0A0L6VL57_9BASI|nr:hypothetical protein VP01_1420g1 [Puccinia sorghi]
MSGLKQTRGMRIEDTRDEVDLRQQQILLLPLCIRIQVMVKAQKGVLVTCDPAAKQLIVKLNDQPDQPISEFGLVTPFIVQELDETHLLVTLECVNALKRQLEAELEKNTFTLDAI